MTNIIFYENEFLGTHTGLENTLYQTVKKSIVLGYYNIQIFYLILFNIYLYIHILNGKFKMF